MNYEETAFSEEDVSEIKRALSLLVPEVVCRCGVKHIPTLGRWRGRDKRCKKCRNDAVIAERAAWSESKKAEVNRRRTAAREKRERLAKHVIVIDRCLDCGCEFKALPWQVASSSHRCLPCKRARMNARNASLSPEEKRKKNAKTVAWQKRNKAHIRTYLREKYWRNPEKARAKSGKWFHGNPDKAKVIWKKNRVAHAEKRKQQNNDWRKRNPSAVRAMDRRRHNKMCGALSDAYVKSLVARSVGVKRSELSGLVSREFLEAKREHLKAKRLIKEIQDERPKRHQAGHERAVRRGETRAD